MSDQSHWDCDANNLFPFRNISVQPRWANRSHRVCLTNTLLVHYQNRSHGVCVISLTKITLCPNPNDIGPTELTCRSHRNCLTVTYVLNRSDRFFWSGPTEFGIMCVTVRFCVEAIYTPPPSPHLWGKPSDRPSTSITHFLRENHLLMCWDQDIPI